MEKFELFTFATLGNDTNRSDSNEHSGVNSDVRVQVVVAACSVVEPGARKVWQRNISPVLQHAASPTSFRAPVLFLHPLTKLLKLLRKLKHFASRRRKFHRIACCRSRVISSGVELSYSFFWAHSLFLVSGRFINLKYLFRQPIQTFQTFSSFVKNQTQLDFS